jgi:hypothetical protein
MIERDYIMRLLKEFFNALNKLINKVETNNLEDAHVYLDELYEQFFKHSKSFFYNHEIQSICKIVITDDVKTSALKSEMLAELLLIDGRLNNTNERRNDLLSKSLFLFEFAEKNSQTYSEERLTKIRSIQKELAL